MSTSDETDDFRPIEQFIHIEVPRGSWKPDWFAIGWVIVATLMIGQGLAYGLFWIYAGQYAHGLAEIATVPISLVIGWVLREAYAEKRT